MAKRKMAIAVAALAVLCSAAYGAERLRFWNLTTVTLTGVYLAPVGTEKWGSNQCENDADRSVDPDERLALAGVEPGHYDVKLTDKKGRTCMVANVEVKSGKPYAFSISDKDLTNCKN
jgi:hypothetical protein